jgi:hypothetical protein
MHRSWIIRLFGIGLVITIFIAGFGNAVLYLWNALMPELFGLPSLTFWQAVGLLCLSWCLFGSWRGLPGWRVGHARHGSGRGHLTSEQEHAFRHALRERCRGDGAESA